MAVAAKVNCPTVKFCAARTTSEGATLFTVSTNETESCGATSANEPPNVSGKNVPSDSPVAALYLWAAPA